MVQRETLDRLTLNTAMQAATINRFIGLFYDAFQELAPDLTMEDAERMAMLVHHSMDPKTRVYHTASHVFMMCEGMNSRQTLAGLFHDIVYYQLDGGFPVGAASMVQTALRDDFGKVFVRPVTTEDKALFLCSDVFGFKAGDQLSVFAGLNEFASALIATRLLQDHLKPVDMVGVVACIEATIPFRADKDGKSALDLLAVRVEQALIKWAGLQGDALKEAVHTVMTEAVLVANRDVSGFAHNDPGFFLSTTWMLIDESNAPLKSVGIYSLGSYRAALMRMELFLSNLNPAVVFQSYGETPDPKTLAELSEAGRRNIEFACDFLDSKIATVAIIEALARHTGSDCPVSMFLGDIANSNGKPDRAEDYLPEPHTGTTINLDLLRVFERGRTLESTNDLTASPLTAFVYRSIGHQGMKDCMASARQMFDGKLQPFEFLRSLDHTMLRAIIRACSYIAFSRRDALLELEKALS